MGGPSNNSGGNTGADEGFFNSEREKKRKQREEAERMERENRDGENNRIKSEKSKKSEEQPKVKSQMDNTEIKSDEIDADKTSPTEVEIDQDDILLKNKKKGRKATVLTSVTGVDEKPILGKKSLLGG